MIDDDESGVRREASGVEPVEMNAPEDETGLERDEQVEADLSESAGIGLGPSDAAVELASDALYILREGNVLVELEDAMERNQVDFRDEQDE